MSGNKKYTVPNILIIAVWILLGSGTAVLLIAAITRKNSEHITGIEVHISGVQNNYFINKRDVLKILEKENGKKLEKAVGNSLDLAGMESALQKDQWIKKAEIFFDNNNVLQVKVIEREPVARIFTNSGASFYMDSSLKRLPLSNKFSARLPVFTGFPTEVLVLTKQDSILLKEIKKLGEFIGSDPFWMAQIEQVDITPAYTFELIPKLGNQVIRFGHADYYKEKFNKLLVFYKKVQTRTGWNRYSILDLQFKNQVVAVSRDAREIKMDSLRTIQIMKEIISDAQKSTNDSTNIQLAQPEDNNSKINHSTEVEAVPDENVVNNKIDVEKSKVSSSVVSIHVPEKPVSKNPGSVKAKPLITHSSSNEKPGPTHPKKVMGKKPAIKKEVLKNQEEKITEQPKAVMPPKSDY